MTRQQIGGFRRVQTHWGESLQELAARELGDASLWVKIAEINGLAWPYITGDPEQRSSKVVMYGDTLAVPFATKDIQPGATAAEDVFQVDVGLRNGTLVDDGSGDIELFAGRNNLSQALRHRINTDEGELIFHGKYGCKVNRLRGEKNNPADLLVAEMYVQQSLLRDDRVARIEEITAKADGDTLQIEAAVVTATGHPLDVEVLVGG